MLLLLNWRVWAFVLFAVAQAAFGWKAYHAGMSTVRAEWTAATLKSEQQAREVEQQRALAVQKAEDEHAKQLQIARHDADSARTSLERLRDAISAAPKASGTAACASDQRADTCGDILIESGQALAEMARACDGHVADVRMLLGAFPR